MSSTVEQIKSRLDIVEVVGSYIKLEKSGINWRALCPFHHEKTPSFFVSPARQGYYCFGCNHGGDMITFVEEVEGLDFMGALRVLADRAGVKLETERSGLTDRRNRIFEVLLAAKNYYVALLEKNAPALEYLAQRGLRKETIDLFGLGFSPDGWRGLYDFLRGRRFSDTEIEEAGLIIRQQSGRGQGGFYDRFRGRLMFPLFDPAGRVAGFSGRVFPTNASEQEVAKYINTPQTLVYNKSRLLYGFDKAKLEIRKRDFAVLVEGQFDLLMSYQAEVKNTVAVSGTALTREHLELVSRLSKNLVMAFDSDRAGEEASRRAIELALGLGLEVKIVELPASIDPAELILKSSEEWVKRLGEAKQAVDFHLGLIKRRLSEPRLMAKAVREEVYPYLAQLPTRVDRAFFVKKIADMLGLAEEVISRDVEETISRQGSPSSLPTPPLAPPTAGLVSREERLLARLLGIFWWRPEALGGRLSDLLGQKQLKSKEKGLEPRRAELILEAELSYGQSETGRLANEIDDLLQALETEGLKGELILAMGELKKAEAAQNAELVEKYLKKCQNVSTRLNLLGTKQHGRD